MRELSMIEGPYKLPEGWRWVRLGEVAQPVNGFGFPKRLQGCRDLPYPFIKVSDLNLPGNEVSVTYAKNYVDDRILKQIKARTYPAGTVIFPKIGGAIATNKKRMLAVPALFDNNIMGLIPTDSISKEYLFYFMQRIDLQRLSQIGPVPSIRQSTVKTMPIPLPPLPEQRRIVARIEELMERVQEAKRLREEAKQDADRLIQAALAEVFPRPGTEPPPDWRWVRLGEVCEHKSGIWGSGAKAPTDGFPIVRSTEITGHRIAPQSASIRSVPTDKAHRYALQSGDILVNKSSGSPHLVGWPAIFEDPGDGRTYLFSNFMLRLRVDKGKVDPWFTLYYLHSPTARANYLGAQDTTSGLRNLRVRDFIAQPIPLPPLPEQRRIATYLAQVQTQVTALKQAQEATETKLHHLEQAILDKAFRGEL